MKSCRKRLQEKKCKGPEEKASLSMAEENRKRLLWLEFGGRVIVEIKVELNEERARSLVRWRFDLVNRKVMALF